MPSRKLIFREAFIELEADAEAIIAMWQHAMTRLHMSKLFAFKLIYRGQRIDAVSCILSPLFSHDHYFREKQCSM